MKPDTPSPAASARLQSLDTYRGLIMVSLAFNGFGLAAAARNHLKAEPDSGFWRAIYHQFEHVDWVGGGYWDLIQPSFMFMPDDPRLRRYAAGIAEHVPYKQELAP